MNSLDAFKLWHIISCQLIIRLSIIFAVIWRKNLRRHFTIRSTLKYLICKMLKILIIYTRWYRTSYIISDISHFEPSVDRNLAFIKATYNNKLSYYKHRVDRLIASFLQLCLYNFSSLPCAICVKRNHSFGYFRSSNNITVISHLFFMSGQCIYLNDFDI